MIVCHCEVVSCKDIRAAAEAGATTLSQACRATGAARSCGGCAFGVRAVLDAYARSVATPTTLSLKETDAAA